MASGYTDITICYPQPAPVLVTYNKTHTAKTSTYERIQIELIDQMYTNELFIPSAISKARTERQTNLFGQYVGGCQLSEKCNDEDLETFKRLFNRSEIVTLHRTQIPICDLQYFAQDIQKIEDGLSIINLGGIYQEYKISLRHKTNDHSYRLGKRTGHYSPEAPHQKLNETSIKDLREIIEHGRISQKLGALLYITERFIEANPNAQTTHPALAIFGAQVKAPPIKHTTSLSELETLIPPIIQLLPSTQTLPEGAPFIGKLGMYADEALAAAQAAKNERPFSKNKFRRGWSHEQMQKRAEYWDPTLAPDQPKKDTDSIFNF